MRDLVASFYLPKLFIPSYPKAIIVLALTASWGCRRTPTDGMPTLSPAQVRWRASLERLPSEAGIVASLDLERLRGTPVWRELAAGPLRDAALLVDGLAKGLGIDPVEQVRQVVVALPGERQADDRFAAILRIDRLDLARATAWLDRAKEGQLAGVMLPPDRVMIARGAWTTTLATSTSPADERSGLAAELLRLCERAAGDHPLWLAAIVPPRLRQGLIEQTRFPDVASLLRLRLAVDVERDVHAELVGELSNRPDARSLALRLRAYLDAAKRHPDMLAQGLAPYLEAVRLEANGPNLHASLALPVGHVGDLGTRLRDMQRPSSTTRGRRHEGYSDESGVAPEARPK